MDGTVFTRSAPCGGATLQRVLLERGQERRPLYWRDRTADRGNGPSVRITRDGLLDVAASGTLGFDTYFNAFFESQWRRHTALRSLQLQVTITGSATLRVYRDALNRRSVVCEQVIGSRRTTVTIPHQRVNFRQHGMLTFELEAGEGGFTFVSAAWVSPDEPATDIGLAVVFCTFNREGDIARIIQSLGADPAVLDATHRVIVVNQGDPGLDRNPAFAAAADLLGAKLCVIEQPNFGGAGGFSRGLLTALADPAVTHAVLLDDDLDLEPDSLLRIAAFYALCERDVILGGHMLDLLHPTRLYEAGAVIGERYWDFNPQHFGRDIAPADQLPDLTRPYAVHYNGWWCCGIPLALLRQHGMPLPCFIRGDDLEFGLRLHQRGVATVPMPGVAVWHEPFYLKLGGWQLYYETRNMLVTAALHTGFGRFGTARRMGRQIVMHLLTYRYFSTALILTGIEDFLAGPVAMTQPPLVRHASLTNLRARYQPETIARERVAAEQVLRPMPGSALHCWLLLSWLLLRNAVLPSCRAPARIMPVGDMHWLAMRSAGHVATETWWDDQLPTYRRTRGQHAALLRRAAGLVIRLVCEAPRAAHAWRQAAPQLTSVPFWREYLGLPQASFGADTTAAPVVVRAHEYGGSS